MTKQPKPAWHTAFAPIGFTSAEASAWSIGYEAGVQAEAAHAAEGAASKALQHAYMTLAEVPCKCSARRREEGKHLTECHLFDMCAALDALAAPAAATAQEGVQDVSGHTWLGMRAAGWMWEEPNPINSRGGETLRHYASHWSTGPKTAERLYRESDIHKLLASRSEAPEARANAAGQEQGDEYFLQDTRSYVGNCPMWWAEGGSGYTARIDKAQRYKREDALRMTNSRGSDVAWPCSEIVPLQRPTIDVQDLPRSVDAQRTALAELGPRNLILGRRRETVPTPPLEAVGSSGMTADHAPAVPEIPTEKQKKLLDLADRIDHEQLWRVAGMDHGKFTPEQKDRLDAGVALRRYAHLWAPGRWVVFPPEGPVHYSASTLDRAYEMAKK